MAKTTKEKRLVCTVNRRTWARGGKNGLSRLLNGDGNMCCLGFLGVASGVSKESLFNKLTPGGLSLQEQDKYPIVNLWEFFVETNDNQNMTDADREKRLKEAARENGFSFRFVGKQT
jgi:hypothetical protein